VLDRAIELAEHFGTRPKESRAAIKRSVYFGGSATLTDGLHIERSEFLATALSRIGQELMLDYMANTEQAGELPLYIPGVFDEVLTAGTTRGAGAKRAGGEQVMTKSSPFTRVDVSFPSGEADCAGWLYHPEAVTNPPVVILGHGLGATHDVRLDAFAERFAAAGVAALAFTYRYFGDSGGQPRQLLSIKRQQEDWDAAISHVKARRDVDSTRIAVWGSSFGGGHAILVAARHPELAAAIAQCPFTDGLASARAQEQLEEHGVKRGDVVALRLTNRIEFVILLFATWRLGGAVTPINPALTEVEVSYQLKDSSARLMVAEEGADPINGVTNLSVAELRTSPAGTASRVRHDPAALALLIYTSGTTGAPKGVMLDHANLDAMTRMGRDDLKVTQADRSLLILPLFHVNGIVVSVLLPLMAGGSVVVASRFNPHTFFDVVEAERPTYFSGVPTIYSLPATPPAEVQPDTSSVRFAVCGAAPAPPELLNRFEGRYAIPIVEGYGLSEATCGSTINPIGGPRRAGTVGLPFPGQELRILNSDGSPAAPGVDGEVAVRGANVMRGYLGRPDETAKVLRDGWLRTGDVGHLDADGYLTLVGRSKEMIIRGGENIYPKEIEDVLTSDPTVLEAAVIGVPDEKWGQVVVAYVQPEPGQTADADSLLLHCAQSLSGYKRPSAIHVLDELPRNAVGKVAKPTLRARHTPNTGTKAG
jgi:acyl-CoA synthetase (AMP-forming)/AMP-acid ligase II